MRGRLPVLLLQRVRGRRRSRGRGGAAVFLHARGRPAEEARVHPRVVVPDGPERDKGHPGVPGRPQPGRDPQGRGADHQRPWRRHVTLT